MPRTRVPSKAGTSAVLSRALVSAIVYILFYMVIALLLSSAAESLFYVGVVSENQAMFLADAASLLSLSFAVFAYFGLYKKLAARRVASALGFISDRLPRNVLIGLLLFGAIFVLELAVSLIGYITNVTINTNVATVFAGAPLWFYVFAALIEPINEEIFFRGFLITRLDGLFGTILARRSFSALWLGTILSAVIFGMAHYTYYSTYGIEVLAALVFGLLAGYVFKKTKSLYPGIIAHILVNSLGVVAVLMLIR